MRLEVITGQAGKLNEREYQGDILWFAGNNFGPVSSMEETVQYLRDLAKRHRVVFTLGETEYSLANLPLGEEMLFRSRLEPLGIQCTSWQGCEIAHNVALYGIEMLPHTMLYSESRLNTALEARTLSQARAAIASKYPTKIAAWAAHTQFGSTNIARFDGMATLLAPNQLLLPPRLIAATKQALPPHTIVPPEGLTIEIS